jgi:recombination DNA repair RAD52 pathway protein
MDLYALFGKSVGFFLTAKDYIYRKDELKKVQKILDPLP